jgi:chromosome partitioning protein
MHLARAMALGGRQVVLVDLDPQANATLGLSAMQASVDPPDGVSEEILASIEAKAEGFWLVPSPGARKVLPRSPRLDEKALDLLLEGLEPWADWVLVDCPPRIDDWGWAALSRCSEVLIPVQAEFFAMQGLTQALRTLEQMRGLETAGPALLGIAVNMIDAELPMSREVVEDLRQHLGDRVFAASIPRDPGFSEAASHGVTLFEHSCSSKGARAMASLAREVLHGRAEVGSRVPVPPVGSRTQRIG